MLKVITSPKFENLPKKEFIKNFNIAYAKGDIEFIINSVTDDIVWNIVGIIKIEGKEEFTKFIGEMQFEDNVELIIEHILLEEREGAASGVLKSKSGKKHAFSDFYELNGEKDSKIKLIASYVIEVE